MTNVSLIIVHWNTPEHLEKQLKLLGKPDNSIEIIVVDNHSDPEVCKQLTSLSPDVTHIIFNSENLGFAKAGNIGAALAKGQWLLFLNPDVMATKEQIKDFITKADEAGYDAASPFTENEGYAKPLPTPASLIVEFTPFHRLIPLSVFKRKTLTGGCLLIKTEVFNQVGKWDEDFFLWFEDSDLTKRLLDNGYKIGWVNADIHHQGGISFRHMDKKKQRMIFFTSMKTYAKKHLSEFGNRVVELLSVRFS